MQIEKAIEILKELPDNVNNVLDLGQQDALKLGIEALSLIKDARNSNLRLIDLLLPGETK